MRLILLAALLFLCGEAIQAFQPTTVPFSWEKVESDFLVRNFTTEDGLPVNSINYIVPHPNGYIYMTTFDGLVQFDGNRFVNYTTSNTPGLKSNRLYYALLDGDENLWFLDQQGHLYMFDNGIIECFQDHISQKNVTVYFYTPDVYGDLWISTNSGLYHQRDGMDPKLVEGSQHLGRILGLDYQKDYGVHFLADSGLFVLKNNAITQQLLRNELPDDPEQIYRIKSLSNGRLWLFGKEKKLFFVTDDARINSVNYPLEHGFTVTDMVQENEATILASTTKGYYRIDAKKLEFRPTKLVTDDTPFSSVVDLFTPEGERIQTLDNRLFVNEKEALRIDQPFTDYTIDSDGSIWLGTNLNGLFQVTKKKMYTIGPTIESNINLIYSVIEDYDKNLWMAGFDIDLGILRISKKEQKIWNYQTNSLSYDLFNTIYQSKSGKIYAGAEEGLYTFRKNEWQVVNTRLNNITALFGELDDRLWIGTNNGAYSLNGDSYSSFIDQFDLQLKRVNAIVELSGGKLAFLTSGNGIVVLGNEGTLTILDKKAGLSSDQFRDVYEASADTLWAVSEDFGLNRVTFDAHKNIISVGVISVKDGLIDNSLHRLIKDSYGFFWLNSNKGIMRINENELNAYLDGTLPTLSVQSFTKEDGLDNIEGNGGVQNAGVLTSDGKLLFPNQGGIIYTRPEWHLSFYDSKLRKPSAEQISFADSSISLLGKTTIALPKSVRDFQVHFTLPEFLSPNKLQLEYKLEGVNQDWHSVSSDRKAVFTNVSGGERTFLMRGKLIGDPKYSEGSFTISIPLLYYETIWFKIAAMFGFILILFVTGWISVRRSKHREATLEAVVQNRTKELTDRTLELEQSREEVELSLQKIQQLDESKSRFFTNFTHELRTPLSLILNPLEDMLEEKNEVTIRTSDRNLILMKRNAERLKDLINQLLDVSKLNSGELSLTLEPLPLFELTRQIISQFEHLIKKKDIQVSIINNFANDTVYMDRAAWEHICTNLISNAIKFTPIKGSVYITLYEEKKTHIISVKDTGIGISAVDIPFIFDAYYQGGSSISKAQGTGIGLSLVKGLVERMKGSIEVFSEEGKGTEFVIHLHKGYAHFDKKDRITHEMIPLKESTNVVPVNELDQPYQQNNPSFSTSILLVEDNEDFREYIHSVISELYTVKVATNGKVGLEALENFQPDIILSDIMMPEMDGYEMMRAIRALEAYKHIPFIFLSAKDSEVDIETGLNSGADIYLTKPVQNKLLLTQIRVLLRREKNLREAVSTPRNEPLSPFENQVLEIIQRHLGNPDLNIDLISEALSMSKATLYRKWKQESEETLNQKITLLRLEEALRLIREEDLNFSQAAYAVGYNNLSYFSQAFKKNYGAAPQEYLKEQLN